MQNSRQLYWGQGLFLSPQHLQQQDLFHQGQLQDLWRRSQPFGWGIRSLHIREEGLVANTFEVLRCAMVTRDGLELRAGEEVDRQNVRLMPKSFKGLINPAGEPLSVYLAVTRYQSSQENLSPTSAASGVLPTRFSLVSKECTDVFDNAAPAVDVSFIEYNLVVLFDKEEAFEKFRHVVELIKVAELVPTVTGEGARLVGDYISPCLSISSSQALFNQLKGIRDLLLNKAQEFGALKRQRGVRATAGHSQDAIRLIMLQTLNRYIPLFQHELELGTIHPEPVYALLRQMVGELSVFFEDISVLGAVSEESRPGEDLPAYDHEDLRRCFDLAISRLQALVKDMTRGPEAGIRLIFADGYFKANLPPSIFEGERTRYYLSIDALIRGEVLWARLQKTGKISPIEDMPQLEKNALFGLKIDYLSVPPEELPQRGGNNSYFQVDTKHPNWARIREFQNIAMRCELDPKETVIKFYVVREE